MKTYDSIIIGGGPGGYLAAELLGKSGKSCLLFEKKAVGGVCLNEGCIPTKSFLYSAKVFEHAVEKGFLNINDRSQVFSQKNALDDKNTSVNVLVKGVESALKKNKVTVIAGEAVLKGKQEDSFIVECGKETYLGLNLIIATGSAPVVPSVKGIDELILSGKVLTSRGVLELEDIPEQLVVIGAGVIGLEMAAYYITAGSKVTVIEMESKIGGTLDSEMAQVLQKELERKGVKFYLNSTVKELTGNEVIFKTKGERQKANYSKVLLSTGRKPVMVDGLTAVGVRSEKNGIEIDDICRTNVPGIYAIGDVTGKTMLAHVAYRQAETTVNDILGVKDPVDYRAVPSVIYTQPEIAWSGLNEEDARSAGYDIDIRKASINLSGRNIVESGITGGLCKLILDKKKGVILGGGIAGNYASEIIYALVLIIQNRIPVESIKKTIFPHPTVCEIIKEALR